MQTMKLLALQEPSQVELLLESLVSNQNWAPAGAARVADRSELSAALQKLAIKAAKNQDSWRAWMSHDGVRFFVAEMSLALSRERGSPALKVSYYDDQGRMQKYSQWVQLIGGAWQPCTL